MGVERGERNPIKELLKLPTEGPLKIQRKPTYIAKICAAHGRAGVHGRLCMDARSHAPPCVWPYATRGLQHGDATSRATFLRLQHGRAFAMHSRASFRSLPFALPGLRFTSTLPSFPCECYICSQNPKILPDSTDKPQYQHIWINGSEFIPFLCGFSMKTERNWYEERAKTGQNRDLSREHSI